MISLRQFLLCNSGQPENAFGPYVQEILKAEGLNGFAIHDLAKSPMPEFRFGDVAILTRCLLSRSEMAVLENAVRDGLRLVCLQPNAPLAALFGWKPRLEVQHRAWIRIRDSFPGASTPIQTHIPLAMFETPPDAKIVADGVDKEWSDLCAPSVARQNVDSGQIVFFFYDLPKAVSRIRFGDPELASLLTTGVWSWLHAIDLFEGHVDERVLHLPQADFHCQLFAQVLTNIAPYPLARLWYYEDEAHRSAAVFSSDDDFSTPEQFHNLASSLQQRGGRATFYLMKDTLLPDDDVENLRREGHSFGPHVNAVDCDEELHLAFPRRLKEETQSFHNRYGSSSKSLQCHFAPWLGYMSWLPHFMQSGFRLLFPYLSAPKWLNLHQCGSGRPMKFVDQDGTIYDCWQQPMQTYDDESFMEKISHDLSSAVADFEGMLKPVVERFYTAIGIGSHPISFSTYSKPFLEACFDLLRASGVPIYSGDDWCDWSDRRHAVMVEQSSDDTTQTIRVANLVGRLSLMLPLGDGQEDLQVLVDGIRTLGRKQRRLEQEYLFVPLERKRDASDIHIEVTL